MIHQLRYIFCDQWARKAPSISRFLTLQSLLSPNQYIAPQCQQHKLQQLNNLKLFLVNLMTCPETETALTFSWLNTTPSASASIDVAYQTKESRDDHELIQWLKWAIENDINNIIGSIYMTFIQLKTLLSSYTRVTIISRERLFLKYLWWILEFINVFEEKLYIIDIKL